MSVGRGILALQLVLFIALSAAGLAWADGAVDAFSEGMRLLNSGQEREAITHLDRILRLNPSYAVTYSNRGRACGVPGRPQRAIQDYKEALRLFPWYLKAYNNRGVSRREKGDLTGALAGFDNAIELNREYARAYGGRGVALLLQSKDAEADLDFMRCYTLDPTLRGMFKPLIEQAKAGRAGKPFP